VIGIIGVLVAVLLPALRRTRMTAERTQCLSNMRQLAVAQAGYAAEFRGALITAGNGLEQGAWLEQLKPYTGNGIVRRCAADQSSHFDTPAVGNRFRTTSYGINNFVSITHAPASFADVRTVTRVRRPAQVIQFVELAERGTYAVADHIHVQDFFSALLPQLTLQRIGNQMPLNRHGGRTQSWNAVLNYAFLDGHAESLPLDKVYSRPDKNLFDPLNPR
jgi:prepilin-type processing-associated H-X9-DG protein